MVIIHRYYGQFLRRVSPGNGTIWLKDLSCGGNETDIASCRHKRWGIHDCDHYEDVSVRCSGPPITGDSSKH